MISKFKKINNITRNITKKIFKKYDYNFILINEKWLDIVGDKFYQATYPERISRDKSLLTVRVKRQLIIDFQYSMPEFESKISNILDDNKKIKIKIRQSN